MAKAKIYRGDTFKGTVTLRVVDSCNSDKQNVFVIQVGATIEVHFPGISPAPSVILSTANAGEIIPVNLSQGIFSYLGSPIKSALMKLGDNQSITVVVTQPDLSVTTFQVDKFLNVVDRANP